MNITEVETLNTKVLKKFDSTFGKKTVDDDGTGIVKQNPKKDKTVKANNDKLTEGSDKERLVKKTYGDFRSAFGKENKDTIKDQAKKLDESMDDYRRIYAYSIPDILEEIGELAHTLEFYTIKQNGDVPTKSAYLDWKSTVRMLEDVRDRLMISIPEVVPMPEAPIEEAINEDISAGSLKLKDGSSVKVSKDDAATINKLLSTKDGKKMNSILMKNATEFKSVLSLAKEA